MKGRDGHWCAVSIHSGLLSWALGIIVSFNYVIYSFLGYILFGSSEIYLCAVLQSLPRIVKSRLVSQR